MKMDAQNLDFKPESFDIIVSRNLTWNLEKPQQAYSEWLKVLKPNGTLLIFDANWYAFLQNESLEKEFEKKRQKAVEEKLEDYWQGEGIDEEKICLLYTSLLFQVVNHLKVLFCRTFFLLWKFVIQ